MMGQDPQILQLRSQIANSSIEIGTQEHQENVQN
ncbi:hypothetical protein A2U01_0086719, partial [Trifolium medium]|nr:hypothetical protein [Trifolium medium]